MVELCVVEVDQTSRIESRVAMLRVGKSYGV